MSWQEILRQAIKNTSVKRLADKIKSKGGVWLLAPEESGRISKEDIEKIIKQWKSIRRKKL